MGWRGGGGGVGEGADLKLEGLSVINVGRI